MLVRRVVMLMGTVLIPPLWGGCDFGFFLGGGGGTPVLSLTNTMDRRKLERNVVGRSLLELNSNLKMHIRFVGPVANVTNLPCRSNCLVFNSGMSDLYVNDTLRFPCTFLQCAKGWLIELIFDGI